MTILDDFIEKHQDFKGNEQEAVELLCPEDFGYEIKDPECPFTSGKSMREACYDCWHRELPEKTEGAADGA